MSRGRGQARHERTKVRDQDGVPGIDSPMRDSCRKRPSWDVGGSSAARPGALGSHSQTMLSAGFG